MLVRLAEVFAVFICIFLALVFRNAEVREVHDPIDALPPFTSFLLCRFVHNARPDAGLDCVWCVFIEVV